jgi:hypothetical protein
VERPGDDAVALAVEIRADVDEKGTLLGGRESFGRFERCDPRACGIE